MLTTGENLTRVAFGVYCVLVSAYAALSLLVEGMGLYLIFYVALLVGVIMSALAACFLSSSRTAVGVLAVSALRDFAFGLYSLLVVLPGLRLYPGCVRASIVLSFVAAAHAVVLAIITFREQRAANTIADGAVLPQCSTITLCVLALVPSLLLLAPFAISVGDVPYFLGRLFGTPVVLFAPAVAPLFALGQPVSPKQVRAMGAAAWCGAFAYGVFVVIFCIFLATISGPGSAAILFLMLPLLMLIWEIATLFGLGVTLWVNVKPAANLLPVQMRDITPAKETKPVSSPYYSSLPVDDLPEGAVLLADHPHAVLYADLAK